MPPRPAVGRRAPQAGDPEAKARLVIDRLDPRRMLCAHEEQGAPGRGLGAADIDGILVDVRVELDAPPRQRPRLEVGTIASGVIRTIVGKESELARVRHHAVPTALVFLTIDRPGPSELERLLQRTEGRVENDHRFGIVRIELGSVFEAGPTGELAVVDTLRRTTRLEGREHVRRCVEHAVDELTLRLFIEPLDPLPHDLIVTEELLKHSHAAAEATEASKEFRALRDTDF